MKYLIFIIFLALSLNANVNFVCKAGIMDNNSAKLYINKLLIKEPKNIECILKLAEIHLKSGEILKGYKHISRAYDLNPEIVKQSEVSNVLDDALEIINIEKIANKTQNKDVWNKLGDNFFDMGVYNEAIDSYEKSLALDKTQENIGLKLALSYKKSNHTDKAVKELENLIKQNKENFYANYYLGKIFRYSLSDEKLAKVYFAEAKDILLKKKDEFSNTEYPHFIYDITSELGK